MKIQFAVELEKEFDNLQRGIGKFSGGKQSAFLTEILEAGVEPSNKEAVVAFLEAKIAREELNLDLTAKNFQAKWDDIKDLVIQRLDTLFATQNPFTDITAYLTLNTRCSYNLPDRYFFVNALQPNPIGTVIHELLHFYTDFVIFPLFKEAGTTEFYADFRESLTVLINICFQDVIEQPDYGYEMHAETRKWIEENWQEEMSIQDLSEKYLEECVTKDSK